MPQAPNGDEAPETQAEPKEVKFLWLPVGEWVKIVVGLLLLIGGGLIGSWWSSKEPHLYVKQNETVRFQGEKIQYGIANITITNDGSKEAEAVDCKFDLHQVLEVKATPEILNAVVVVKGHKVSVTAPALNPGESLVVSAATNDANGTPEASNVAVRGKGVVGETKPKRDVTSLIVTALTAAASLLFGVVGGIWASRRAFNAGIKSSEESLKKNLGPAVDELLKELEAKNKLDGTTPKTNN